MIVEYLSTFIPRSIKKDGVDYDFQIFINHAHYDVRFCYDVGEYSVEGKPPFLYLFENIDSDEDLIDSLKQLREMLKRDGLLEDDYATDEGYTKEKYEKWLTEL